MRFFAALSEKGYLKSRPQGKCTLVEKIHPLSYFPLPFSKSIISLNLCLLYSSNQDGSSSFCIIPCCTAVLSLGSGTDYLRYNNILLGHQWKLIVIVLTLWREILLMLYQLPNVNLIRLLLATTWSCIFHSQAARQLNSVSICSFTLSSFRLFTFWNLQTFTLSAAAQPLIFYSNCFSNLILQILSIDNWILVDAGSELVFPFLPLTIFPLDSAGVGRFNLLLQGVLGKFWWCAQVR